MNLVADRPTERKTDRWTEKLFDIDIHKQKTKQNHQIFKQNDQ
jgi:hypothetical protein